MSNRLAFPMYATIAPTPMPSGERYSTCLPNAACR